MKGFPARLPRLPAIFKGEPQRRELFSSYQLHQLGKPVERGHAAQPQLVIDCRIAADNGTRGNVIRNPALCRGDGAIANPAMTGYSNLARENHEVSNFGRTCKAHLGAKQRILANA